MNVWRIMWGLCISFFLSFLFSFRLWAELIRRDLFLIWICVCLSISRPLCCCHRPLSIGFHWEAPDYFSFEFWNCLIMSWHFWDWIPIDFCIQCTHNFEDLFSILMCIQWLLLHISCRYFHKFLSISYHTTWAKWLVWKRICLNGNK